MPRTFLQPETTPAALAADPSAGRGWPFVSLTTDFGARDPSTAICVGVVHAIAPTATVMTVTAEIAKFKIRDGALTLWATLPYLPVGAHVAVVDPGVGTARHPLALATARGDVLIGPDNGLLIPAAERLGGITAAHRLEAREYQLPDVSTSFHGRDIFAPAGAHLANGVPIEAFGRALDPATLARLEWPVARVRSGALETAIVYVDSFGNVKLVGEVADLEAAVGVLAPDDPLRVRWRDGSGEQSVVVPWVETFGRVPNGAPLAYEDAYGRIAWPPTRPRAPKCWACTRASPDTQPSLREVEVAFVSVTADFGPVATAICRGVILTIAPQATVIDLTANVPAFDVRAGSLALWYGLPWLPVGTHVAVVDPGVGTERLGVAIEVARGDVLVGPDNGLFTAAAERLGGIRRVHALEAPDYRLPVVTTTFHGRDVFAPAAGHLAAGVPIDALGRAIDPTEPRGAAARACPRRSMAACR